MIQKKILCLGNNTEDTDRKTRALSDESNSPCHGLLSELDRPLTDDSYNHFGYYHSSIYDVEFGRLLELMDKFDQIIVLDQSIEAWDHPDAFYRTLQITTKTISPVRFVNQSLKETFEFFSSLVKDNPSFCIFPFIELLVNYDYTTVCCRSSTPVAKLKEFRNFQSSSEYNAIRKKMLAGERILEHCSHCYRLENQGIISARQQETVEWAHRLKVKNLEDLDKIAQPAYYEIRASNKCNLQCRMCNPQASHLIEREYRKIGLINKDQKIKERYKTGFEIVDLDHAFKIYVAGGEPTVMKEFYSFLQQCIDKNKTDIEFLVNTNGTNINEKFKKLLPHFKNFHFVFSIDGYDHLNHYIRWPSEWNEIVDSWEYLRAQGHKITINTTVSIYNISSLHKIYEFIDQTFPGTLTHCAIAENLSPYLFPNRDIALKSLSKVMKTDCYRNDLLFASSIDGYFRYFQDRHTKQDLSNFFRFNDLLDHSRKIRLVDYVPELDFYRNNSYNQQT